MQQNTAKRNSVSDEETVYIYRRGKDNVEVILTGRTAVRKTGRNREYTLHEIKPKDEDLGFTDWVVIDKLFVVQN